MREVIYKYEILNSGEECSLWLPKGSGVLKAGMQNGNLYLWIQHDAMDYAPPMEMRTFRVLATGQEFEEDLEYHGTVFDGIFVWHVMEVMR